ncbi:thioredoxin family protein [Derxia gummosa]|uniref:Thioredoxin family protein n=1 Tax=Derxia gummosa DSM 723 TaxID=1121388 RepID=A0A9U5GYR0_9BURK|nr:thioredoxin family protein [Derxia gummosa]
MADELFARLDMRATSSASLDADLAAAGDRLVAIYLWGEDCFNCGIFKQQAMQQIERIDGLGLRWLHADVYADAGLGRRFALHGVPAFFFFKDGKRLGRITGWPGIGAFVNAVRELQSRLAGPREAANDPVLAPDSPPAP